MYDSGDLFGEEMKNHLATILLLRRHLIVYLKIYSEKFSNHFISCPFVRLLSLRNKGTPSKVFQVD